MTTRFAGGWILHERAREHHYRGPGPSSVKWFPRGAARYRVGRARFAVDAASFLVLNDGEEYEVEIEEETESFCVFFDRPFAQEFTARTHAAPAVLATLAKLRARGGEETIVDLENALAALHGSEEREIEALDAARPSTRRELYRRAHLARDFIAASIAGPVPLVDIAGAAALSPNHLLRTFRLVFGTSPHQYLTALRLERARTLLAKGTSVTETCFACGFESLGSFSALFRKRFGVAPSQLFSRTVSRSHGLKDPPDPA